MRTAGLPISQTLGLRQHFCCRCPILNPGPVLDSSLKTTRGMYFEAFAKPPKRARLASFRVLGVFQTFLGRASAFELKIIFLLIRTIARALCA